MAKTGKPRSPSKATKIDTPDPAKSKAPGSVGKGGKSSKGKSKY